MDKIWINWSDKTWGWGFVPHPCPILFLVIFDHNWETWLKLVMLENFQACFSNFLEAKKPECVTCYSSKIFVESPHCTVFRQASILSGSGFNEFLVGLLRFQFFSWKRNGLGINPAISRIFLKLSIIYKQSKSAKKHYFEHVWAKFVQPSMLTWYQWTCSKRN